MEDSKKLHCFHYTHLTFDPETKVSFIIGLKLPQRRRPIFGLENGSLSWQPVSIFNHSGYIQLQFGTNAFASHKCRNENLTPPKAQPLASNTTLQTKICVAEFEQRQKITKIVKMCYCYFWGANRQGTSPQYQNCYLDLVI